MHFLHLRLYSLTLPYLMELETFILFIFQTESLISHSSGLLFNGKMTDISVVSALCYASTVLPKLTSSAVFSKVLGISLLPESCTIVHRRLLSRGIPLKAGRYYHN